MLLRKFCSLAFALALVVCPLLVAHAAGGEITGTVTDPQGAIIIGASVTVTDTATNKTFTTVTAAQGRYKISVPAGTYNVVIAAKGFKDARQEGVQVADNKATNVDARLEVVIEGGNVTVMSNAKPGASDPVYLQLRQQGREAQDFAGPYATVNNLVIKRDAATFTLHTGEIYFTPALDGRTVGAVFFGDGELTLTPPTDTEKHSLALFTDKPTLDEPFTKLVLRFTDKTFDEIKASAQAQMSTNGPQASRAHDAFRDNQSLLRKTLHTNMELRTLADIYAPQRAGFFTAFIDGKHYEKLVFQLDPLGIPEVSPEEVMLASYGDTDGGFWTAFHRADEYAKGTATSAEDHRVYDITHHELDATIKSTKLSGQDRITLRLLAPDTRVLPFNLYRTLRVSHVRDADGHDLDFVQGDKDDDADFAVIYPQPLTAGQTYTLTIEYQGDGALHDEGSGNFILGPRETWYPNNSGTQFGDRAIFDMTFRYSKDFIFIGTGDRVGAEARDGDVAVSKWSSGKTELAVAGFNFGRFKKKEVLDPDTGYNVEFYGNDELPDWLKLRAESAGGMISTTGMANNALADAQNATRLYNTYFGKMPYTRLAISQQPAPNFGQAWPTLVYMPLIAFMDSTQRYMLTGGNARLAADNFWEYVEPHEIAHLWWGHAVGWDSYHDQWMSEGFAEFSASLFVEQIMHDEHKFIEFWNDQRDLITQARPQTRDHKPYTVGPVTQGYRLNSGKTGSIARFMIYPKGAYILHMLREMMYDRKDGDKRFMAMMQDFVKTYYNRDVSTEDFKQTVEKHMTQQMDLDGNHRMDWFFNQWVYGTELPSYKFEYKFDGNTLSGQLTQSGVSDNFRMLVPIYVDFGKGWMRLGEATVAGNSTVDLPPIKMPQPLKRAAACPFDDVLALNIENKKQ